MNNKSKIILFWIICYVLSLTSLTITFPILLLTFYPYSVISIAFYVIGLVALSLLSFYKRNVNNTIKTVLFCFLLIPIVALIITLVAIQIGLLHFPG